jgi:hypothetical protein
VEMISVFDYLVLCFLARSNQENQITKILL